MRRRLPRWHRHCRGRGGDRGRPLFAGVGDRRDQISDLAQGGPNLTRNLRPRLRCGGGRRVVGVGSSAVAVVDPVPVVASESRAPLLFVGARSGLGVAGPVSFELLWVDTDPSDSEAGVVAAGGSAVSEAANVDGFAVRASVDGVAGALTVVSPRPASAFSMPSGIATARSWASVIGLKIGISRNLVGWPGEMLRS